MSQQNVINAYNLFAEVPLFRRKMEIFEYFEMYSMSGLKSFITSMKELKISNLNRLDTQRNTNGFLPWIYDNSFEPDSLSGQLFELASKELEYREGQ